MLIKSKNLRFLSSLIISTAWLSLLAFPSKADTQNSRSQLRSKSESTLLKNLRPTVLTQNQNESERSPRSRSESTPAASEVRVLVSEISVKGVNKELEDIIYSTISTRAGSTTTKTQLQSDLNAVYATGWFENVEVLPQDTPLGVKIVFNAKANPKLSQVKIKTALESSNPALPDRKVREIFGKNYDFILNLQDLQAGIIKVNQWYAKNGYELAQVVGAPQIDSRGNVTLIVAEGTIENINIRYFDDRDKPVDGKTREFVITREIESEPGQVFKRDKAQRDLQRLYGLGIFQDVRLSFSPGKDPNQVVVNVDVVEASGNQIDFGGGYSSDTGLFGTVSLQQKNIGGNNQTLATQLEVSDKDLLFDLSYTDPWIASSDNRLSYTVNAFRNRSTSLVFNGDNDIKTDNGNDNPLIVRTGGGIRFARPISSDPFERQKWRLSSGLQYQRVAVNNREGEPASLSADPTPNNGIDNRSNLTLSGNSTDDLFSLSFNATRDRLNDRLQPTKGSLLNLETEQTVPIGSGNILFNRVKASYSQYFPVNLIGFSDRSEALAFNIQAGTVFGDLPPYEAFVLGGGNSIRGFDNGEVGSGRSRFQATAEYRFPVFKIVRGAMFFDYGTTLGSGSEVPGNPSAIRNLPGSAYGYGLGIRINTPIAPVRIDYAINDDGEGQIQFGLGEKF